MNLEVLADRGDQYDMQSEKKIRSVRVIWTALLLGLVSGCGTSGPTASYDASKNRMVYRSEEMTVGQLGSGLSAGDRVVMRAVASCQESNCVPETVRFVFMVEGGGDANTSAIQDQSVYISADGAEYSWSGDRRWLQQGDVRFYQGAIVRVGLSLSEVEQIANASSISARLGNTSLKLAGRAQSKLRNFIQTIRNSSTSATS